MSWSGGFVEWIEGDTAYLSVVFSWQMQKAYQRAAWYRALGYRVRAGGPAVVIRPQILGEVADISPVPDLEVVTRHNPSATFTSRGCPRKCPFCIVPEMEGNLTELDDWIPRPIICDNNLLACSRSHFDRVIDKLKPFSEVDFNQGLDCRLLTKHHAERLRELNTKAIRIAWDHVGSEKHVMHAIEILKEAGFPLSSHIRVYVLIGFNDTPEDALYRFQTLKDLRLWSNPMRYQPVDSEKRNGYVAPEWTEKELKTYMRYWSKQRWLASVPFEEYAIPKKG